MSRIKQLPTSQLNMELAKHYVNPAVAVFEKDKLLKEMCKRLKGSKGSKVSPDPVERELHAIIARGICAENGWRLESDGRG